MTKGMVAVELLVVVEAMVEAFKIVEKEVKAVAAMEAVKVVGEQVKVVGDQVTVVEEYVKVMAGSMIMM